MGQLEIGCEAEKGGEEALCNFTPPLSFIMWATHFPESKPHYFISFFQL